MKEREKRELGIERGKCLSNIMIEGFENRGDWEEYLTTTKCKHFWSPFTNFFDAKFGSI